MKYSGLKWNPVMTIAAIGTAPRDLPKHHNLVRIRKQMTVLQNPSFSGMYLVRMFEGNPKTISLTRIIRGT
jgi:hypothetical protein